jgi:hypothetical protein
VYQRGRQRAGGSHEERATIHSHALTVLPSNNPLFAGSGI